MSGLEQVVARISAIERRFAGGTSAATFVDPSGGNSFAAELDLAAAQGEPIAAAPASPSALAGTSTPAVLAGRAASALTPLPGTPSANAADTAYRPAHVTETDDRVWNDCTWASASMFIDKLTGGAVKVNREALRSASGDRVGGSSLDDVVRGAQKLLGLDLSGARAEHLTVGCLLDRLASGGGAIVQGSYASLPTDLTRYDPGFAAKGVAASGHAVYVGPLDRSTGKVWWDDPLAPAGASGQWISVDALRGFLWTDGEGRVSAMATPAGATSATGSAGMGATQPGTGSGPGAAAAISAAAWSAGVDRQLLTAYLDAAHAPGDALAIVNGAHDLETALARFGRADIALASLGAAQAGSSGAASGSAFASDVLRRWAELSHPSSGS